DVKHLKKERRKANSDYRKDDNDDKNDDSIIIDKQNTDFEPLSLQQSQLSQQLQSQQTLSNQSIYQSIYQFKSTLQKGPKKKEIIVLCLVCNYIVLILCCVRLTCIGLDCVELCWVELWRVVCYMLNCILLIWVELYVLIEWKKSIIIIRYHFFMRSVFFAT
ncbi:hypothetical protein RFI_01322, partial [Reticulomyxa filosa]